MPMNRTLLILLSALCLCACGKSEFDRKDIKASFGVISDCHIDSPDGEAAHKLQSALSQLKAKAAEEDGDGLDGVLIAGDLINNAYSNEANYVQVEYFKSTYESVLNPVDVPLIYTPGNHDTYREWTPSTIAQAQNISDRLGPGYFLYDKDMEAKKNLECRHCEVNGTHILCIVPVDRNPVCYAAEQLSWLDSTLEEITGKDPHGYVLILTHPMIFNTVYGSRLGEYWYTAALSDILEKYPQAVTFGGHLHFPLNDPRSIWQGRFTAFGCGSVRYMAIEDGAYEDMRSKTVMLDANEFSQGLLIQIDGKGNLRATRMDFHNKDEIGQAWTIGRPRRNGSHLNKYASAPRKKANSAPVLSDLQVNLDANVADGTPVSVTFPAGSDDEFVHDYVITVSKADGTPMFRKKILADFYYVPKPGMMKKSWTRPLGVFAPGAYTVTLCARDSWGAQSGTVSRDFTVE